MLIGTALPALLQASILLTLTTLFRGEQLCEGFELFLAAFVRDNGSRQLPSLGKAPWFLPRTRSALPLPVWLL
jgi:hypothetical protein